MSNDPPEDNLEREHRESNSYHPTISSSRAKSQDNTRSKPRTILSVGICIIVLIQIGNCMQKAPLLQLYLENIAHRYEGMKQGSASDDEVQKELVLVRSTQSVLETLPSK